MFVAEHVAQTPEALRAAIVRIADVIVAKMGEAKSDEQKRALMDEAREIRDTFAGVKP